MTQTVTVDGTRAPARVAGVVIGAVCALAAAGGGLAVAALAAGERPDALREAPAGGAWDARTSFGTLSVTRLERFTGMPHGGHGAASPGTDRIRVSLAVANRGPALPFSAGQFRLRPGGAGTTVSPARPGVGPRAIGSGETVRLRITYRVPASGRSFALVFDDLGRPRPHSIRLGALPGPRES